MIIELIGTPGAGKTTLVPTVIEYFQERGICARTVVEAARPYAQRTALGEAVSRLAPRSLRQPLLWQVFYHLSRLYGFRFFAKNPKLIQQVLSSQRRRPIPAEARRHVLHWWFHLVGCYEFLKAHTRRDEALIFDEGFIHRVVQLNASDVEEPAPARILAYVDLLPRPDLVIFPKAPREVCEKRIHNRGIWKHLRHKNPAEISTYIANSHLVVNLTIDYMKVKGWPIIEIDNGSDDPTVSKAELRKKLTSALGFSCEISRRQAAGGAAEIPAPPGPFIFHIHRPSWLSAHVYSLLRPLDIPFGTVGAVLSRYGLELTGPIRNLPMSRRSRNVVMDTSAGKKVLKLYRPQWEAATIIYGHSILARLTQLNFPAPRPVATPHGETFISLAGRNYALFDFVQGTDYSCSFLLRAHRLKLMAMAGQTLARLHRQLEGFMPEGRHHLGFKSYTEGRQRDRAWHIHKVQELKERSRNLSGAEERSHADWLIRNGSYILEELCWLDECLRGAALRRLVIHGDYGAQNLLFLETGAATPLDFELARLEWCLSDLVSALSRLRFKNGAYDFQSMQFFMKGYLGEYPLSAEEWQLLPRVWRFYKLQSAVQYWNSYFETSGPTRKLISARDAVSQADWVLHYQDKLLQINPGTTPPLDSSLLSVSMVRGTNPPVEISKERRDAERSV